jgi:hypothetical protein
MPQVAIDQREAMEVERRSQLSFMREQAIRQSRGQPPLRDYWEWSHRGLPRRARDEWRDG